MSDPWKEIMFAESLPKATTVVIIGGGIHGVGVAHDLVSRGFKDVLLLEKREVGAATSRTSTKLIHGGLRYLERVRDFPLVHEALQERQLMLDLHSDLVKPCELLFPILKKDGLPWWKVKAGLSLYDTLAGRRNVHRHRRVDPSEVSRLAPGLKMDAFSCFFSFWDGQTDDLALVRRVALSASMLGAAIVENIQACKVSPRGSGLDVVVKDQQQQEQTIHCRVVINCAGPWAGHFLRASNLPSRYEGINNKGVHLVYPDIGLRTGLFLQSPEDGRIFFVLPWKEHTLVGTTESSYQDNPDALVVTDDDVRYLQDRLSRYLTIPDRYNHIETTFAGLRWLAAEKGSSLSKISRESVIEWLDVGNGRVVTVYGGKLTTYRRLAETIGDRVSREQGAWLPTRTATPSSWFRDEAYETSTLKNRFSFHGQKS